VVAGLPDLAALGEALVIASEVGFRKPHPAFFEAIHLRLGLPPARLLFAGDHPENDLAAPRRAGFKSVLIDRRKNAQDDLRFSTLAELVAAIRR
jgi:putative hydrolase of the HAD superfamily